MKVSVYSIPLKTLFWIIFFIGMFFGGLMAYLFPLITGEIYSTLGKGIFAFFEAIFNVNN